MRGLVWLVVAAALAGCTAPPPTTPPPTPTATPVPVEATPTPRPTATPPTPPDTQGPRPAPRLMPALPNGWRAPLVVTGSPGGGGGSLSPGGPIYVSWAVSNGGDAPAGLFFVDLLLDGVPVERWVSQGLAVGEVHSVIDWEGLAYRARLTPGDHRLTLLVDAAGLHRPEGEAASVYSVGFTTPAALGPPAASPVAPARLPNLEAYAPQGWSSPILVEGRPDPAGGERAVVRVAYRNAGLSTATGFFQVHLYWDGVLAAKWGQRGLMAGEAVVTPPWEGLADTVLITPGPHELRLVVDPTGLVDEVTRGDNAFSMEVRLGPEGALLPGGAAPAPVSPPSLQPHWTTGWRAPLVAAWRPGGQGDSGPLYSGGSTLVSWAIGNTGGRDYSEPYTVELLLDGKVAAEWVRPGLRAGGVDMVVEWPLESAPPPGLHTLALRLRQRDDVRGGDWLTSLGERSAAWLPGLPPEREAGGLAPEEVRRRLATLEGLRSSVAPAAGGATAAAAAEVVALADAVYYTMSGRTLAQEPLSIHALSDAEYQAWVAAECRDVSGRLPAEGREEYLRVCLRAAGFAGYQTHWNGIYRIVVRAERPPMELLITLAHELGHFRQGQVNPALDRSASLDILALREAQAYVYQMAFLRRLERMAGVDLLLYPRTDGYRSFLKGEVEGMLEAAERSEHARGRLLAWLALLSDPALRRERTELFNTLSLTSEGSVAVFQRLVSITPAAASAYVGGLMRGAEVQARAIESLAAARLVDGLPYWNEGPPAFRDAGLLLP